MTMQKPLRDLIKQRFEKESLSAEQMECLQKQCVLEESRTGIEAATTAPQLTPARLGLAGLVMVGLLSLMFSLFWSQPTDMARPIVQEVAQEVANNHIKMKPLELETDSMAELEGFFTKLDFNPVNSRIFTLGEKQLLGGRYCSIQGITAAQLRYRDEQGRLVTLYETVYDPDTFSNLPDTDKGEQPLRVYARGLEVNIWIEKNLLFVSASVAHSSAK